MKVPINVNELGLDGRLLYHGGIANVQTAGDAAIGDKKPIKDEGLFHWSDIFVFQVLQTMAMSEFTP